MKTYRVRNGVSFNRQGIERAFNIHMSAGLIKHWHARSAHDRGTRKDPVYVISLTNGDYLELADMWEAFAFVNGIATTRQAYLNGKAQP